MGSIFAERRPVMNYKATISVILSGILWGVISLFIKPLSAAGFSAMQISCIRMIIAAFSFTAVMLIKDPKKLKIKLKDIWLFVGTGIISVVLFNCCYFYTMINSQASVAVVLLYTSPVFVMIMSAIFFKEKITAKKIIALLLTLAGCISVAGFIGGGYRITPIILATGLGAGLFYALYTIFGRLALAKYDTMTVTAYTFIFGLLGSLPIGGVSDAAKLIRSEPKLIILCVSVGIISTVLPYYFYTWGLNRMESGKAAILVAVEPLVGAVIGMTVFRESHDPMKLIGICLIIAAIFVLNLNAEKTVKKQ